QLRLTMRMLGGDVMLAEAFGQAIADYGPVTTARNKTEHEKTLDTIALFGPPTYRITWAGAATTPAVQPLVLAGAATAPAAALATGTQPTDTSSVQHVPANPNPTLDLTISYTPQSVAFGQLYQAQSSIGTASLMVDRNLPLQPYIDILLDQPISGALIRSASFIEYSGVDPVIPIVAPLDQAIPYTEPEYQGGSVDRATWLRTYVDGDGRSHLIVLAGQWFVRNHRERLLQRLSLELLPAPHERDHHDSGNRDHGDYGRGGDDGYDRYHNTHRYWNNDRNSEREISHVDRARACWRDRTFRSVHVQVGDSEGLARIEVVMIADGHFTVFPMRHSEERWAATIRITPGATYFIQRVDQSGYVSFDPNGGDLYQVPQEVPCTCEQPDHEAGAHEEG
ncbi:MAG: hypothetical protein HGA19_21685, partial [Oscillochloris sp.]|nr:hypothetical protein [Oscillochloris sp.]